VCADDRSWRDLIYAALLRSMSPEHKFNSAAKLCGEVLAGVADGLLPLSECEEVLRDALCLMACKEIKVGMILRGICAPSGHTAVKMKCNLCPAVCTACWYTTQRCCEQQAVCRFWTLMCACLWCLQVSPSRLAATEDDELPSGSQMAGVAAGGSATAAEAAAKARGKLVSALMKRHLVEQVRSLSIHQIVCLSGPAVREALVSSVGHTAAAASAIDRQLTHTLLADMLACPCHAYVTKLQH
jgi:hypothetical protein